MVQPVRIYAAVNPVEFDRLYDEDAKRRLTEFGELVVAAAGDPVSLPPNVAEDYDVVITSWSTEPFAAHQLQGGRLRLVIHSAGSVRRLFPRDYLTGAHPRLAQGGANAMALPVAEMAVTLTLALLRNLHTHDRGLQSTRDWSASGHGMLGRGITSQRVGIVGLSRTGRHYARMIRGLGAQQLSAYDPYASAEDARDHAVTLTDLAELCRTSDVLSICAPSTPETAGLVTAELLSLLPDGAIVVNTARSAVVDEAALTEELVSGRLRGGLDVFDEEPLPASSRLYGLPNVVLTPHVAGGTVEARHRQGATVVEEIASYLADGTLRFEVTTDNYDRLA